MTFNVVLADENGTVANFEDFLINKAQQEKRTGRRRKTWIKLAEMYELQKYRLKTDPYPEEIKDVSSDDENLPVVKEVIRHTHLKQLYRWGLKVGATGNHRILYTIHNYHKIVLLHHFIKRYNGDIKRKDIEPAEAVYFKYLERDPSHYPVEKG